AGITTFLEECVVQAKQLGYVETMLKRRRPIPEIESTNPSRRAFAERTAINSVVQGSAADLVKLAMVEIHETLKAASAGTDRVLAPLAPCKMLLQIHDELVFEAPAGIAEQVQEMIVAKMEGAMTLTVPLKVDASISANWFEGK
ncbi:MAG: DNA polymerase I, partial [Burkholderiales bacterium]|nr:DNA polymerase I [Phycisphaerae bacterium]